METCRKSQRDNLLKTSTFFGLKVSVTEHKSLNSSKGIIRNRMLKGDKETEIVDYLKEQGVTACTRFTIKKDHETVETNTLLLTFNTVDVPKSLKIFYRIVPVDMYVPNPLRCFNCQRFGHHESNCPVDIGSVCEKCGTGGHDHHTSSCKSKPKCVNCGKEHLSRSNTCEIWKKEKEIMKIKATKNVTYLEAKKLFETQSSELDFSKKLFSLFLQNQKQKQQVHNSLTVISLFILLQRLPLHRSNQNLPQSQSSSQPQSNSRSRSDSSRSHSQTGSQSTSQSSSQSSSQSNSQSRSQSSSQSSSQKKEKQGQNSGRRSHSGRGLSSDKHGKGSDDPIKMANKFDGLEDGMDFS